MLQRRPKSEGVKLKIAARSTILRKNNAWVPDKSVPCPCEGQLCPLSTIYIIKGFLQKQGMEAVNWSVTNTKNISLPSWELASNEYDARTKLSVCSTSLTPRGTEFHNGIIAAKEILGLENNATCTCKDIISGKASHNGKGVNVVEKSKEGVEMFSGKRGEEYSKRGDMLEKDLFKKPSKCWVEVDGNCKMGSVIKIKEKAENDALLSKRSAESFESSKLGVGASTKTLEDPKIDNQTPDSGTKEEDHEKEDVTKRHLEGCPLYDSNTNTNCRHRLPKCKSGKRTDAIQSSSKVYPYVEKNEAINEFDDILKNRKDESSSAGIEKVADGANGHNATDMKEQIGRFNEKSSIIAGFNKRYSRTAVSTRILTNQMNHRRLLKKFYGSFDSKRLQKNFTVNKLLDTTLQPTVQNMQKMSGKRVLPTAKSAPSVRSNAASSNDPKFLSETRTRKGVRSAKETASRENRNGRMVKMENNSSRIHDKEMKKDVMN